LSPPRAHDRLRPQRGAAGDPRPAARADGLGDRRRCGSDAHQGVCADVEAYRYADAADLLAAPEPVLVALDEVTDPQNMGAVCRTAECVGATGVILPERRSAEVTPAVCKASADAVEHLAIAGVRNLADFLDDAKAPGAWTYGAAAGARTRYRDIDWRGGVVLVLGAEGRGLRPRGRIESHVLGLYLDGHSYTGTGEQLGCDCKTVGNALQRVNRKVGAHIRSRDVLL
jgi:tRNA(Leu) C34 or U34 (ribose-2'-O)-methylase TrmL